LIRPDAPGTRAPAQGGLSRFFLLRAVAITALLGMATLILQITRPGATAVALYGIVGGVYLLTGTAWFLDRLGFPRQHNLSLLLAADLMLVTAFLYFAVGSNSPFALFYLPPIVMAAWSHKFRGGMASAVYAALAYGTLSVLESRGVLVHEAFVAQGPGTLLQTYLHVCLFLLVGFLAGSLSEGESRRSEELAEAEREITRIRLDTDSILQNMASGVVTLDMKGRVISANAAAEQILSVPPGLLVGRHVGEALAGRAEELAEVLLGDLESGRSRHRSEVPVARAGGEEMLLGVSTSFLSDRAAERRGVVAVFQDLTEVRKMQDEVRRADRMAAVGELAASIAHEVRNPLASIRGSIEFLSSELDLDGDNVRLMNLIIEESDRLEKIITDFLEFARMPPQILRERSLGESLEQTLALLRKHPDYCDDLKIVYRPTDREVVLRVDDEQIRQVFLNLALNACEAMEGRGTLTVSTRVDSLPEERGDPEARPHLVVSFADTGPGIPPRLMSRIFEPFFSSKEEGTGLGLSIAARILAGHQGKITARNREGGGTIVETYLPIVRFGPESSGRKAAESKKARNRKVSMEAAT
jgi:two-component system sensor histidine kinase PilS (NtrC family)